MPNLSHQLTSVRPRWPTFHLGSASRSSGRTARVGLYDGAVQLSHILRPRGGRFSLAQILERKAARREIQEPV